MRILPVLAVLATASIGASQSLQPDSDDNVFPKADGGPASLVKFVVANIIRDDVRDLVSIDDLGRCRVNYAPTLHRWGFDLPWTDVTDVAVLPGGGAGGRDALLLARASEIRRTWVVDGTIQSNSVIARGVDLLAVDDLDDDARQDIVCADGANLLLLWGSGGQSLVPVGAPVLQLATAGYVAGSARQIVVRTATAVLVLNADGTVHDLELLPTPEAGFAVVGRPGGTDKIGIVKTLPSGAKEFLLADDEAIGSLPIVITLPGAFEVASYDERVVLHSIGASTAIELDISGPFVAQTIVDLELAADRTLHRDLDGDGAVDRVRESGSNVAVLHSGDWDVDGGYYWFDDEVDFVDLAAPALGWPLPGMSWDITLWTLLPSSEIAPTALKHVVLPAGLVLNIDDVTPPENASLLAVIRPVIGGVTGAPCAVSLQRSVPGAGNSSLPPTVEPPITEAPPPDTDG